MISPGTVVEIRKAGKSYTALCLNCEKNKIRLLLGGKEISMPPDKILFPSEYTINPRLSREELCEKLKEIHERRDELKSAIPLEELWQLLLGEEGTFSVETIGELNFGGESTSDQLAALHRALNEDIIFFKSKKNEFYPNLPENVSAVKQMLLVEKEKKRKKQKIVDWIKKVWQGEKEWQEDHDVDSFIDKLKYVTVNKEESRTHRTVNKLLSDAALSGQNIPFRLLVKAGIWDIDENLDLYTCEVPVKFTREVLEATEKIVTEFVLEKDRRLDLTDLHTITIDSEHTLDMDDALSITKTDRGYRAGIHITDVAEYVSAGSILDLEARARATSIYLPEGKISMFPENLSTGFFSLIKGEIRPAISFLVDFDSNFSFERYEIKESLIQIKERMTYEEVNCLIEREDFALLDRISDALKERRKAGGANFFYIPELEITVDEEKEITIKLYEREVPSNKIVSEMMIIANELCATYCKTKSVPLIYRSQPELDESITLSNEYDPVIFYQQRKLLKKSDSTTHPLFHYGLGVEAYSQMTSPIRRYSDLVVQRQLKNFLNTGDPLYTPEELDEIIMITDVALDTAGLITRKRKRYWLLKYLGGQTGKNIKAVVLENQNDRLIIMLKDYFLELSCQNPRTGLLPGDEIEVKIETSLPREDIIKVSIV